MGKGSVNKAILVGNLGQDPEVRQTQNKTSVATLSIATNEAWQDKEGNKQERTEWHRVLLWAKQAEFAGKYLKKGTKVYVEGKLQTRSWEDGGHKRSVTEIVAQALTPLDTKSSGAEGLSPPEAGNAEDSTPPITQEVLPS